jgi:Protein of unknown function (DUF3137)
MAATLDSLGGRAFDDLYRSEIEPELKRREVERQQAIQALALFLLAGVLAVAVESFIAHALSGGELTFAPPGFVLITLGGAGYIGYLPLRKVARGAKADIIGALCKPIGLAYQASHFEPAGIARLIDLRLLAKPETTSVEDHFEGERAGWAFELYEATLTRGSGRSRRTVFRGQILSAAFPHPFEGITVVLRDAGPLSRFECPPTLDRIALEDPKFEGVFEVFGSDQVAARAILTPTLMQAILELEAAFAGERLRFAFMGGEVHIAMEGHNRFEIGALYTTLVDRRRVEAVARDIAAVFQLVDSLAS